MITTQSRQLPQLTANKLRILEVESWFEVLTSMAKAQGLWVQLENRFEKAAVVYCLRDRRKLGRIWIDITGTVCFDLKSWVTHFEPSPTIESALARLVDLSLGF